MKNVIVEYDGLSVAFTEDGWFHATPVADRYGKRVADWLENQETKTYQQALAAHLKVPDWRHLVRAKRGRNGGTWLHPKLAVVFARWLDVRFAVWCDFQIDGLLRGTHVHHDWRKFRHEASSSFKVMCSVLQLTRLHNGKETLAYHFANEAKLINWALTGTFKAVDRDGLSLAELDLLADLEERNSVMLGIQLDRDIRKTALEDYARRYKEEALRKLEALDKEVSLIEELTHG